MQSKFYEIVRYGGIKLILILFGSNLIKIILKGLEAIVGNNSYDKLE